MINDEVPQGKVLNISEIIRITEERHDARLQRVTRTRHEISVGDLGFKEPACLTEINEAVVRLGYEHLSAQMLLHDARTRCKTHYFPNHIFVLFKEE